MLTDQLLRRRAVETQTGLSRSSIYRLMHLGEFPRPLRIGLQAVAWRSSDIDAWLAVRDIAGGQR